MINATEEQKIVHYIAACLTIDKQLTHVSPLMISYRSLLHAVP